MRLLFCAIVVLLAAPALGKDRVPQGIGFAQTEDGTWLCRNENSFEALACARDHCIEEDPGRDCLATTWCYPAHWSGEMTVRLGQSRTMTVLCGMASEEAVKKVFASLCSADKKALGCDLTLTVDPDGFEHKMAGVRFAGGGAPPPTEEAPSGTGAGGGKPPSGTGAGTEAKPAGSQGP